MNSKKAKRLRKNAKRLFPDPLMTDKAYKQFKNYYKNAGRLQKEKLML